MQASHTQRSIIGASTLVLAGDYPNDITEAKKISSNAFADSSNQNAGNVMTGRSTTRLLQAPGGNSTICLGAEPAAQSGICTKEEADESADSPADATSHDREPCLTTDVRGDADVKKTISANAFASGTNQNAGNAITDRP